MEYDMIDRFLRNNLGDDDYAKYSAALDSLCTLQRTWVGLTDKEIRKAMNSVSYSQLAMTHAEWVYAVQKATEAKLKERNT